jgi:fructosamine-3-kinase
VTAHAPPDPGALRAAIAAATGLSLETGPEPLPAGGGGRRCLRWRAGAEALFVKLGSLEHAQALEAEANALEEIRGTRTVRVPVLRAVGTEGSMAFLALEWIEFHAATAQSERLLGEQLARLHAVTAPRHGWHRDNTLGATPQPNGWMDSWPAFFARRRLGHQLDLAGRSGQAGRWLDRGRVLCERVPALLAGHVPPASLLHGDLWGGNWTTDAAGRPVIFDPATYYGDRETDLAMTRLFGGFGRSFYAAYEAAWPPEAGADLRRDLYELYHVINHVNLFGGGYVRQAEGLIERLLAASG